MKVDAKRCPQNHRCPVGAISQDGFGLPVINEEVCVQCANCVMFCPMRAMEED